MTTINPTQGPSGTQVTADGLNVSPGDIVLVNEQPVPATAVTTPSSPPVLSAAQFKFTLPANLPGGTAHITLRRSSDNIESDPMNFAVQPFITGSNAGGGFTPGDSITLNGSGFLTNASVHFTPPSQPEQVIVPGSVTATSVNFTVPTSGFPTYLPCLRSPIRCFVRPNAVRSVLEDPYLQTNGQQFASRLVCVEFRVNTTWDSPQFSRAKAGAVVTSIGSIVGLVTTNSNRLSVQNGLLNTRQAAA